DFIFTPSLGTRNPEWKNRIDTIGLRFERIGVERRGIVEHLEVVNPIEVVVHEARTKADRVPLLEVLIDLLCATPKAGPRPIQLAIMLEIMNADFESVLDQIMSELGRDA